MAQYPFNSFYAKSNKKSTIFIGGLTKRGGYGKILINGGVCMQQIKFTKMHGIGNDYIYINCFEQKIEDPQKLARRMSPRRTSVGSDGLILICPSDVADFEMKMYNADGSNGGMCGNGARCFARFVRLKGLTNKRDIRVSTANGRMVLTVTDDDLTSGCDRVKSVKICTVQMLQCILSASRIQRVAVRQERFGSQAAEQGCHSSCIIGTQVCQVSGFAEMDFNGSKAIFQRKLLDACPFQQAFHFIQKIGCRGGTQIRVVYFCFFHVFYLFIVIVSAKITDYFHINRYMAKKSREIPFDK